ncbi:hypothetical protein L9F63_004826, partial [Diploptera punctata]
RSSDSNIHLLPESSVTQILPEDHRVALIIVGFSLGIISFFGNTGALLVVFKRKQRFLYKCSLASLALGDLILGLCHCLINFARFFVKYSNVWLLGEAMCSLLPMFQIMCLLTNSMTLSLIALDRYLAVRGGANKKWEPKDRLCVFIIFAIWTVALVARYIWKQSIPLSKSRPSIPQCSQDSTSDKTKKTKLSPTFILKSSGNSNSGSASTLVPDAGSEIPVSEDHQVHGNRTILKKPKKADNSAQTKRKIRTFKIILILIFTCFLGRMPSWIYNVTQSFPQIRLRSTDWWILQFWFNLLSLSSTALNPFLYCFLNETLEFGETINNWIQRFLDIFRSKNSKAQKNVNNCGGADEIRQNNSPVSMIPRGPYQHKENRVEGMCVAGNYM